MQRVLEHADLFLVVSALVAVCVASLVAVALGFDSREVALLTALVVGVLHGGLALAVRRLRRAAYEPPTLRHLDAPQPA